MHVTGSAELRTHLCTCGYLAVLVKTEAQVAACVNCVTVLLSGWESLVMLKRVSGKGQEVLEAKSKEGGLVGEMPDVGEWLPALQ